MKLTVTQENLSRALTAVSRVASSRASLPILSNVLLKTSKNRLILASTNLDIAVTETIGAKIQKEGAITVPARLMQDFVGSLPSGNLDLEIQDNKLLLHAERFESTINGMSPEEFPVMPTIDGGSVIPLAAVDVSTALNQVLFAASNDEARPVLTGVYFSTSGKRLHVAATDSYRLAEKRVAVETEGLSLLVPSQALSELVRALKDGEGALTVTYDEQQARFAIGGTEIVTRLIEGAYPDYKKLLPSKFETTATLSRKSLTEVTKVSSLFAREAAGSITLSIDAVKNEISIRSIASQIGENTATAEAEVSGDAEITLNSRYILDALSAFEGERIQVNVNGKLDPCVFTDPDDDTYQHVIMPVKS